MKSRKLSTSQSLDDLAAWCQSVGDTQSASPINTVDAGRTMARAFAASIADDKRLAVARSFGFRLIGAWWQTFPPQQEWPTLLRAPLQAFETTSLPPSVEALADSLGAAVAKFSAETATYLMGVVYTSMLPRTHRAALGIFYTPPALTDRLISQATLAGVDWKTCRILDPACGGGAFLAPVARRILDDLPGCSPRILVENIANRIRGYEIDPFGAWLSQVALDAVLLPITQEARRQLPVVVTVCDSLQKPDPRDSFDLVIGNPPYGRIRLDPNDRAHFKRSLYGHANLYGLFTDIALRHARPGGVIAYVTPTSFLAGEYFKNLRALLGRDARPVTFDFVSVRRGVFDDVLQETLLATYKRGRRGSVSVHEITPVEGASVEVEDTGSYTLPTDPSQPWILPRCALQAPLVAVLGEKRHRLEDWGYTVSTGPLVWNRYKPQLVTRAGRNRYPLIWAEAVTADGRFIWRAEKKHHTSWFEVRKGDDWLITTRQCVLLQRTTAKEQNRRLIATALPADFLEAHGAVVIENHLNMLRPLTSKPCVSSHVLAAFMNSSAADRAFRCINGSVAVSAYELKALPLPPPDDLQTLARLVRSKAAHDRIEAECARLYEDAV